MGLKLLNSRLSALNTPPETLNAGKEPFKQTKKLNPKSLELLPRLGLVKDPAMTPEEAMDALRSFRRLPGVSFGVPELRLMI